MRNLTIIKKVKISFTAEQWQLYHRMAGTAAAAKALNVALAEAVNAGLGRDAEYLEQIGGVLR